MTRFIEGTIVVVKWIELTEDETLRLEIEMIEMGRLLETDRLEYDNIGSLVVKHEPIIKFMDQQTQPRSSTAPLPLFIVHPKLILQGSLVEPHIMNMVVIERTQNLGGNSCR